MFGKPLKTVNPYDEALCDRIAQAHIKQARLTALDLAVKVGGPADMVMDNARSFYDFIVARDEAKA